MALSLFGFYNGLTERERAYSYFQRYGHLLDEIAFFEISIQENGELSGHPSRKLINEAHHLGTKALVVITNLRADGQFSTALLSQLVRDPAFSTRVYQNIRNLLNQYRLDGVNLDLEKAAVQDRNLYTQFIYNWTMRLKQENYWVSMDVPAKTGEDSTDIWKGAFDYQALGQIVDEIVLMTYEEHWPGSPPGSVASLPWVNQVLDYALINIPTQKVNLGVPLYGYDWVQGNRAKVVSHRRATELARRFGAPLRWDAQQHSTFFRYESEGKQHTVYFEDVRSLKEKLDLATRRGIKGVALWEMNLSYPELWTTLQAYKQG
ncbi:glycosyl hydrolase family 18 protein [Desulfitobacterium sp.]|uniref:glycosyl hydrolase family 18 protein n=1 Tax=Desulfitobacterium sp. TaxID=49981 RepID=UPI002C5E6BB7|nr:glycosyl hydrolase family 18 protein [Desulfitobacterium sp.]HVJ49361.1 glycosyl hydrolase family 18 protein [Desulfitobacterium sp.]